MSASPLANDPDELPALYRELAPWFHLLTAPAEYADEATEALRLLTRAIGEPPQTILELGCGGGNNASHMKAHARLTLTDLSPQMLEVSRSLNPECEHLQGDMTTLRLDRTFDAVFVHDAVDYLTSEERLRAAIKTAWVHCRPGGAALFAPDLVRERFVPRTEHGGHDGTGDDRRALRYLMWTWDPDPDDTWYVDEFAYLLREGDARPRVVSDRHVLGLFSRSTWLGCFADAGFEAEVVEATHGEDVGTELFLARRPG